MEAREPTPVAPLHLRLFNDLDRLHYIYHLHLQHGYACASPPSPLYASRLLLAQLIHTRQFEVPQAWETTRKDSERPATADPAGNSAVRPRVSHLVPRTSRTSTSHNNSSRSVRVRVRVRPMSQFRERSMCTGTTQASGHRPPPPSVQGQRQLRHCPRMRTRPPALAPPSHVFANPYTSQFFPGPYA